MKNRLKINIILFEMVPIIFYMLSFFILFIKYKVWIAILIIIPLIEHIVILTRNMKKLKNVKNKIDNAKKIIYDSGAVILSDTSIISIKNYVFSIDYKDVKFMYTRKRMFVNCRANSLCIVTKNKNKYELVFINWLNPFSSKNKQIKEIIKIIKSHNVDINI